MRKILILGGSSLQLDLIFEAKKMLFEVHLVDGDKDCVGQKYSDYFYPLSFGDQRATLLLAQKIAPDVVTTCASEVGNITACYISEKLGLLSNSYQVACNTTDKYRMKQVCAEHQIPTADYLFLDGQSLEHAENWQSLPCIVKPADSSAGRGVRYISDLEQLPEALTGARYYSRQDRLLIEAYIPGQQFSVETLSVQGEHQVLVITEEFITPLPKIIETQQLMPARISEGLEQQIREFSLQVLKAFEIEYGACHLEVRLNETGLFLVEIASRMGGWRSELLRLAHGVEYCQLLILSHLGQLRNVTPHLQQFAAVKVILSESDYQEYLQVQQQQPELVFADTLPECNKTSEHLADANGYYFLQMSSLAQVEKWVGVHAP